MTKVMEGIRVLEVAQFTFVPAAGGVMTDWGADVIKIEHPVRGDAQRGIQMLQRLAVNPQRSSLMQHPNRGKRSVGIDISTEEGRELLYERSEEHTSELQSLMRISYAVFCLKKKKKKHTNIYKQHT